MTQAEIILFWATIFSYTGAFCLHLFAFVSQKPRGVRLAIGCLWIGLLFHTATGIVRWIAGDHPPVTDTYELNLTGTWFMVLPFLAFERLRRADAYSGLIVTPLVFLILGHGFMGRSEPVPMGPAYQSPWLVIHVVFAWLAFGCYAISTGAAVLLLLRQRFPGWKPTGRFALPETLDIASYRFIVLGFINHAVMLVSGAIWAKNLWGRYWSWDALETWSLIAFLFYAFYMHSRTFLKWKMGRAAWLTVLGLIVVAVSFWGVDWFAPTVHPGP
jgi:cytochrome c-type biogenesis protein CcsB